MNDIVIENASIEDIDEISKLENSYPFEMYSSSQLKEMFAYDYYTILKCVVDERIVGYLCSTIIFEECNLLKIIVDKNYRKLGIGKSLINKLIEICKEKGVRDIYLEVRNDNNIAIRLYEGVGFEFQGIRYGYYNGIDAKIYRLDI